MPAASDSGQAIEAETAEQTEAVGARLASTLRPGDLVLVAGELGSGKTTLIRGACRALGVEGPITSPTFTIGHLYRAGDLVIAHLDLYRLGSLEEEDPTLLSDYIASDRISFVEWPEIGAAELENARMRVRITQIAGDRRRIDIEEDDCEPGWPAAGGG